jgi:hypothetical protein
MKHHAVCRAHRDGCVQSLHLFGTEFDHHILDDRIKDLVEFFEFLDRSRGGLEYEQHIEALLLLLDILPNDLPCKIVSHSCQCEFQAILGWYEQKDGVAVDPGLIRTCGLIKE